MKKSSKRRLIFNFLITFVGFFLLAGISTAASLLVFLRDLSLPLEYIKQLAPYTFINLVFMSVVFGILGTTWKKLTIEKPMDEINRFLIRIKRGDLSQKLNRRFYSSRYSTMVNNINLIANELSSIDTLKVSLLSNISHELKTPVSVISNYATMLQDTSIGPEKQVEYAKAISESSKKMTELITNILKLNQLENQNIPNDMSDFDISEQLCEGLLEFEDIWEEKSIEIITDIEEFVIVHSNKQLMSIVWNNLLSNAFKFTPENGSITVNLKTTSKYAVVEIADTGCGISEEHQELIFDKFFQCDTSRSTDGNGLGLALVKRIIDITNCFIKVDSTVGEGTKFTVKIPRR